MVPALSLSPHFGIHAPVDLQPVGVEFSSWTVPCRAGHRVRLHSPPFWARYFTKDSLCILSSPTRLPSLQPRLPPRALPPCSHRWRHAPALKPLVHEPHSGPAAWGDGTLDLCAPPRRFFELPRTHPADLRK